MNETKRERLFDGITGIRDDLIEEAAVIPAKRHTWRRWAAVAACVCLVLAGAVTGLRSSTQNDIAHDAQDENQTSPAAQVVAGYDGAGSTACYKAPDPGEFYCELDLAAALEAYAGQDVRFFVGVDVFSASEYLRAGNAGLQTELERLRALGLSVGYAQAWEYQGAEGAHVTYTYVAGSLTAETLQNFPVSPEYGYSFRFVRNGDGSAPTPEQQNIVTAYPTNAIA